MRNNNARIFNGQIEENFYNKLKTSKKRKIEPKKDIFHIM